MRLLFAIAIAFSLTSHVSAEDTISIGDVPLPIDIEISEEGSSPFAGVWLGRWDSWWRQILVVEGVDAGGLFDVIYSVGRDQHGGGNWFRDKAREENGTLVFADDSFAARYTISDTGRLRGKYPTEDRFAVLERQDLSAVLATPTEDWFQLGLREFLVTDIEEGVEAIELAVAIYAPDGDGPFPLALVHHGSTGSGKNARDFDWFFTNDWFADVLIVDHLDVVEHILPCSIACEVGLPPDPSTLQKLKEVFRKRIIIAISTPAHAGIQIVLTEKRLPPLVRMDQDPSLWFVSPKRLQY